MEDCGAKLRAQLEQEHAILKLDDIIILEFTYTFFISKVYELFVGVEESSKNAQYISELLKHNEMTFPPSLAVPVHQAWSSRRQAFVRATIITLLLMEVFGIEKVRGGLCHKPELPCIPLLLKTVMESINCLKEVLKSTPFCYKSHSDARWCAQCWSKSSCPLKDEVVECRDRESIPPGSLTFVCIKPQSIE